MARNGTGGIGGPDGPRGTIRAVARQAGVSVSTVSNVLNNPAVVAAETRGKVEAAMAATGYVRNAQARQLRGVPSAIVGVVILDLANPFYGELARGVEDALDHSGCRLLMASTDASPDKERRQLRTMEEQGVRGVLLTPVATTGGRLREMARHGTRVVLVDHPGGPGMCSVATDNVTGARLAVDHLLALGHRRIAFLKGSSKVRAVGDRRLGVVQSLTAAGLDPAEALLEVRLPASGGADAADAAVGTVLGHRDPPTAVFCLNDIAALGAVRGLRRRGVRVPADMSVVGYDDVHFADLLDPGLTTVHQPSYDLGRAAAGLLLDESRASHVHRQVVFRPSLVVRGSTAPPPGRG
ncbi:LacI family DNA-binding transcriptional regulator [Streptomyces sp. NPDC020983]|uniref:LacI family DNA-binding transcriptional regulator n=1 Tax=Streptomyces sp. NPDC020983 TaxID=3365106 RepID=UPI0037988EE7